MQSVLLRIKNSFGILTSFFFDTCFLTSKVTQVENTRSANNTMLVHYYIGNQRSCEGENSFYANTS